MIVEESLMVILKAKVVDSTHLELAEPIDACQGRSVLVSVAESPEADTDRQQWLAASESFLLKTYGDSEPDYPVSMVKEINPDYGT